MPLLDPNALYPRSEELTEEVHGDGGLSGSGEVVVLTAAGEGPVKVIPGHGGQRDVTRHLVVLRPAVPLQPPLPLEPRDLRPRTTWKTTTGNRIATIRTSRFPSDKMVREN